MKSCPKRTEFYQKLGSDQAKVAEQLQMWLKALEAILVILVKLYIQLGLEKA